jgi:hypothetical protein
MDEAIHWEIKGHRNNANVTGQERVPYYTAMKTCPTVDYLVKDYDGFLTTARTVHVRYKWNSKLGRLKCFSSFYKSDVGDSLYISFDDPIGMDKKGTWVGGLETDSILMREGEDRFDAMKRYCDTPIRSTKGSFWINFVSEA